jgi:hypothetical protein
VNAAFVISLCLAATGLAATQRATAPPQARSSDTAAFKDFNVRVQAYLKVRRTAASGVPALKTTDSPEVILARQTELANAIRAARPGARIGDILTPDVCEAFRHASKSALAGPNAGTALAYMQTDGPDPGMVLTVNAIYPSTEPITALSPALLAAFPILPAELAYRLVGRSLTLVDVQSHVILDVARLILPQG